MFYLFMADGTEEVEAIATLDVMRRAGIETVTAGVGSSEITGSHSVKIKCDISADEIRLNSSLEGIVLPGGMPGTINLENDSSVQKAIAYCSENGLYLCAICAAPSILGHAGILENKNAVCFPGFEKDLYGAQIPDTFVCRDGNIITGRGMGCAVKFGLEIVKAVKGEKAAEKLKSSLQCSI